MERERAVRLLEDLRQDLVRARAIERAHLDDEAEEGVFGELAHADQHQADAGTETYEREKELTIVLMLDQELADIDHALQRLSKGTYGTCEACGAAIADERLEAVPAARLCAADQQARDIDRVSDSPAARDLAFLADDDEVVAVVDLAAEESGLHLDQGGGRLAPDRIEQAEAVAWAEHAHDEDAWSDEGQRDLLDIGVVVADEERL